MHGHIHNAVHDCPSSLHIWNVFAPPPLLPPSYLTVQDIVDSGTAFTVTADAPGFEPNDVKIELKDGRITISGHRNEDKKQEQDGKVSRAAVYQVILVTTPKRDHAMHFPGPVHESGCDARSLSAAPIGGQEDS